MVLYYLTHSVAQLVVGLCLYDEVFFHAGDKRGDYHVHVAAPQRHRQQNCVYTCTHCGM